MGDFCADLLKYETDVNNARNTAVIPQVTSPTRIRQRSKTLINNIFSTHANVDMVCSGILTPP